FRARTYAGYIRRPSGLPWHPNIPLRPIAALCVTAKPATQCLLWVKSRHSVMFDACPLYPSKQTLAERITNIAPNKAVASMAPVTGFAASYAFDFRYALDFVVVARLP